MAGLPSWILTFVSAELFFILVRSGDLKNLFKRPGQRTKVESNQYSRGLARSVVLEAFIFVPASAVLLLLIAVPIVHSMTMSPEKMRAVYALLGIASYGFPFGMVRVLITRAALNTLKEFAAITATEEESV